MADPPQYDTQSLHDFHAFDEIDVTKALLHEPSHRLSVQWNWHHYMTYFDSSYAYG
jgi:hypothetical protein